MTKRVVGAVLFGLIATLLSIQPAAAQGTQIFDPPTEPRCLTPFSARAEAPILDFENIDGFKRASIRYEGDWVATITSDVVSWEAPNNSFDYWRDWEVVLWPGGDRLQCSRVAAMTQIDAGPDSRACVYRRTGHVSFWGDFRGKLHLRYDGGWIQSFTEDYSDIIDPRLGDSGAFVRIRQSGQSGFVDVPCTQDSFEEIKFEREFGREEPAFRPSVPSLENANFELVQLNSTLVITDKETGDKRVYQFAFDNLPTYISEDGRFVHWYREGDPTQAEAADLDRFVQVPSVIAD